MNRGDEKSIVPTPTHYFIRMLKEKGLTHRIFTQNTDELHIRCGLTDQEVIHAHGRNGKAVCAVCGAEHSAEKMDANFETGEVYYCECEEKKGPIKPNAVWFNERMP